MSALGPPAVVELEVPFHDVDALRIVWHGHHYKYMELARTALLRARDLDADTLGRLGLCFVVADARCHYGAPLRYGERVRVTARVTEIDHRVVIRYDLHNLTSGRRAARGRTALVTVRLADGTLLYDTPEPIRRRLLGLPIGEEGE